MFTIVLFSLGVIILATDANVYAMYRYHLNSTLVNLIWQDSLSRFLGLNTIETVTIYSLISIIFLIELILAIFIARIKKPIGGLLKKSGLFFIRLFTLLLAYLAFITQCEYQCFCAANASFAIVRSNPRKITALS